MLIIVTSAAGVLGKGAVRYFTKPSKQQLVDSIVKQSKNAKIQNNELELIGAANLNNIFVASFKFKDLRADKFGNMNVDLKVLGGNVLKHYCTNPEMNVYRVNDIEILYKYSSTDGVQLYELGAKNSECNKI